ncbi:MAG: hypothetical protein IJT58_05695 [Synergistaceae bacterium]|nr:hypothetical protein [Synergistaceae bacterium]
MRKFLLSVLLIALFTGAAYSASSRDVYRIGVMRFANKAPGMSYAQAEAITDMFIRMISNSKHIAVLERERLEAIASEQRLSMSGLVDANTAVQIGRIAGCQYMVLGSVTQFDSKQAASSGAIPFPIFGMTIHENKNTYEASITIDMRIVNVETSEVVMAMSETGNALGEQNSSSIYWSGYSGSESSSSNSITGIESKAVEDAVTKLGIRIREEVSGEYTQVLSATGNEITLSVGATSGARKGGLYKVYADGSKIFDMDGNELGSKQIIIAAVEITDVQNNFSTAKVNKNWGNASLIKRGDKIMPISLSEVRDLVKKKAFAKTRPHSDISINTPEPVKPSGYDYDDDPAPAGITSGVTSTPAVSSRPSRQSHPKSKLENTSTDPGDIVTKYDLPSGEINTRRIEHINANKLSNKKQRAYKKFVELAESYDGDYLAAFRAGELARSMRQKKDARRWFKRALEINPDYVPAKRALERL